MVDGSMRLGNDLHSTDAKEGVEEGRNGKREVIQR